MSDRLPSTRTTLNPAEAQIETRIEAFHGALEAHPAHPTPYCVRSNRAVTTAERRALCAVSARVQGELAPCANRDHIDTVVTRVLLGFEQGRGRGDDEVYAVPTQAQRDAVSRAAEAHLKRVPRGEPNRHRAKTDEEISAARGSALRASLARLREVGRGSAIGRLIGDLDARRGLAGGAS